MLESPNHKVIKNPRESRYTKKQKDEKLKGDFHRVCLNVKNGHSSQAHNGASNVSYANVDSILNFIKHYIKAKGIEASDISIGTPFVAQTEALRNQIKIRFPGQKIEVFTIGVSQGSEKKLWIACFTVANTTEPASIGNFQSNWLRVNVLISRAQAALVTVINFDLMRPSLPSLDSQNPTWAQFLIDQLNYGPMVTVEGSKTLPKDVNEWNSGDKSSWPLTQNPSEQRNLHENFKKPPQDDFKLGTDGRLYFKSEADGRHQFSKREKEYLPKLHARRERAQVVIE